MKFYTISSILGLTHQQSTSEPYVEGERQSPINIETNTPPEFIVNDDAGFEVKYGKLGFDTMKMIHATALEVDFVSDDPALIPVQLNEYCTPDAPCDIGFGDCNIDDDCLGDLVCGQRDDFQFLPGLTGLGVPTNSDPEGNIDYCYDPKEADGYDLVSNAHIAGNNIQEFTGKSLQECKEICDNDYQCKSFEFYAYYEGSEDYNNWAEGGCIPQSTADSPQVCNVDGGDCFNNDLYVKNSANDQRYTSSLPSLWYDDLEGGQMTFTPKQIHFHMGNGTNYDGGKGSEHELDGQHYNLEMHIVNLNENVATQDKFKAAVIGVLFYVEDTTETCSFADGFFQKLIAEEQIDIDFQTEFIDHLNFNQRMVYRGSLTTPPYSELLFWTVLPTIIPINKVTHDLFLFTEHVQGSDEVVDPILGNTNRDVQPLNGRHVYKVDISESTSELRSYLKKGDVSLKYSVLDEFMKKSI